MGKLIVGIEKNFVPLNTSTVNFIYWTSPDLIVFQVHAHLEICIYK